MSLNDFFRALQNPEHQRAERTRALRAYLPGEATLSPSFQARLRDHLEMIDALLAAADEVSRHARYIEVLGSVHRMWGVSWDWLEIKRRGRPPAPVRTHARETAAKQELETFIPGFSSSRWGSGIQALELLRQDVEAAKLTDEAEFTHAQDLERLYWLSSAVLDLRVSACSEALRWARAFSALKLLGTEVELVRIDDDAATLRAQTRDEDLIPKEEVKALASGKVTRKPVPISRYWSLYQEHVCSCAIRIALETFAVVPVRRCIINSSVYGIDLSTGHMVDTVVLAIHMSREDLEKINMNAVSPSAALRRFPHRISFKKTSGFTAVSPMSHEEQWVTT